MSASENKQQSHFNQDINPDKAIQDIPLDFPTKKPPSYTQLGCQTIEDVIDLLATLMAGNQSDLKGGYATLLKEKSTKTETNNLSPEVRRSTQQQLRRIMYRLNELKDRAKKLRNKKEDKQHYQQILSERAHIVGKLSESIEKCLHGYQDRLGNIIRDLYLPKTVDGLLAKYRLEIIERCFQQLYTTLYIRIGIQVHIRRACYNKANSNDLRFIVPMPPLEDIHADSKEAKVYDGAITKCLKSNIKALYTPWHMLKFFQEQLTIPFGYFGFNKHGYKSKLHEDILKNLHIYFTPEKLTFYCDKLNISLDFMMIQNNKIVDIDIAKLNYLIITHFIAEKYIIVAKEKINVAYVEINSRVSLQYITNRYHPLNSLITYEITPDPSDKSEDKEVLDTSDANKTKSSLIKGGCFLPDLPLNIFGRTSDQRQVFLEQLAEKIPAFRNDMAAIYGPNGHRHARPIHTMSDFRKILTVMHPDLSFFATKQFFSLYFVSIPKKEEGTLSKCNTTDSKRAFSVSQCKGIDAEFSLMREHQECSGEHQRLLALFILSRMHDIEWSYYCLNSFFTTFYLTLQQHPVLRKELLRKQGVPDVFSQQKKHHWGPWEPLPRYGEGISLLKILLPKDTGRMFHEARNRFYWVNRIIEYWTAAIDNHRGSLPFKGEHTLIQHLNHSEKRRWFFESWDRYYGAVLKKVLALQQKGGKAIHVSGSDIATFFKDIPLNWQYKAMMQEVSPKKIILHYLAAITPCGRSS